MLRSNGTTTVAADGTATWASASGVAFTVVPTSGGRYPVTVVLDEDTTNRTVVVSGPNEERGTQPFRRVQLAGGRPGDQWTLFTAAGPGDLRRQVLAADSTGRALVRAAGGEPLAQVDFAAPGSLPDDGSPGVTALYLAPGASGFAPAPVAQTAGAQDPTLWDASNVVRLRVAYQALGLAGDSGATGGLALFVDGFAHARTDAQALFTVSLGTTNQFADAGRGLPVAPLVAWAELGAPVDVAATLSSRSTLRASFYRVRLVKPAGYLLSPGYTSRSVNGGLPLTCNGLLTVEAL